MTTLAKPLAASRFPSSATALLPKVADLPWLIGYAVAFWTAHHIAAGWGGRGFYSLLYPAAGLRIALLWRRGPQLILAIMLTEMFVQVVTGVIDFGSAGWGTCLASARVACRRSALRTPSSVTRS